MTEVKTLAALKRHFAAGGGIVLEEYYYNGAPCGHNGLGVERYPEETTSKGVWFDDGNYLAYGTASQWTFQGDTAICDEGWCKLVYRLID